MNILYTITRYLPAIGGAEIHVHELASRFSVNHTAKVITHINQQNKKPVGGTLTFTQRAQQYYDGNVPVSLISPNPLERIYLLPVLRLYHYPRTQKMGLSLYSNVYKSKILEIAQDVDIIHNVLVGTEYLSFLSWQIARKLGIPFVITPLVHVGIWGDSEFLLELYRQADAVIALLNVEKGFYVSHGVEENRVHVIGVGPVLSEEYNADEFRRKYEIDGKLILFLGRKVPHKGYREILASVEIIWERHPDTYFIFIGPKEKELDSDPFLHYNDRRILDIGRVNEFEKTSALAACDIFCMPSVSEILPTVFLEAWSFAKPVIGGDIPTLRELISDGKDGFIVPQSPEAIAKAILKLLDNESLAQEMGMSGQQKVLQNYTQEKIASKMETLYNSLVY